MFFVYLFCFMILELKKACSDKSSCEWQLQTKNLGRFCLKLYNHTIPRNYGHYGTTKSLYQRGVRMLFKLKLTFNWNKPRIHYICMIKVTIFNLPKKLYLLRGLCAWKHWRFTHAYINILLNRKQYSALLVGHFQVPRASGSKRGYVLNL